MIASKVSESTLRTAASEIGVSVEIKKLNMRGDRFQVKVNPDRAHDIVSYGPRGAKKTRRKYQRTRVNAGVYYREDAKVHAVCWHGFRDYFRACFRLEPNAVFATAYDTWNGSEDFENRHRASATRNIGSQMYPKCAADACMQGPECEED